MVASQVTSEFSHQPNNENELEAVVYFQELYEAFHTATQVKSIQTRTYTLGGYTICLKFAGNALISAMTPALEHLATEASDSPDFTIYLWDSTSTGVMTPPPPWRNDPYAYAQHGEVKRYSGDRIRTIYHMCFEALSMMDFERNEAIFWVRDAAQIPFWETASPLKAMMHWWSASRGLRLIHGAAVGTTEGGVLMVGNSGSGKSTSALACLNSDLVYVGDDYCLLGIGENPPQVYSLYSSAKLKPEGISRLPHLASLIENADRIDTEKPFMLLQQHFPTKIVSRFPVKAVLVPRIRGGKDTSIRRASTAESLLALAPSTMLQLPSAQSNSLQTFAQFLKLVPSYVLELGTDLTQIPQVIAELLERTD